MLLADLIVVSNGQTLFTWNLNKNLSLFLKTAHDVTQHKSRSLAYKDLHGLL
jgi:hypothetical protein